VEELRVRRRELVGDTEVAMETERFRQALAGTKLELEEIAAGVADIIEGRQLMEVHTLLLNDPAIIRDVEKRISEDRVNADFAVSQVLFEILERFRLMKDPYLRDRGADIRDVGRRVMAKLLGTEQEVLSSLNRPVVLVSRELDPSYTAGLSKRQLLGIATDLGGSTSHTAILARSLGIPAVVSLRDVAEYALPGQTVIVDGIHGDVVLDPDEDELHYYTELKKRYELAEAEIALNAEMPTVTADGIEIELAANIEFSQEADQVKRVGGCGIGLFRTEFIRFLSPESEDLEEVHYRSYVHALEAVAPDPVIIRTLDLGGDKFMDSIPTTESNPFLGWRAIRICLDRPEKFIAQLRAVLRAAGSGNARLMIPMITEVSQMIRVREMLVGISADLDAEGIPHGRIPLLGMMVETPAAAVRIEDYLPYVDFVSIGSNDLTQYTLAVDRGSPYVSRLFDPLHPAVLELIERVVSSCSSRGVWTGMCGEMSSSPLALPLLIGFGLNKLSVSLTMIPDVKKMISVIDTVEARDLARSALRLVSAGEVRALVLDYVRNRYPEIILDELRGKLERG
jgi:phosphoenolpyruvate-protein phosphotransferase (PTS system enzyme I)